jgi:hypothetical protein
MKEAARHLSVDGKNVQSLSQQNIHRIIDVNRNDNILISQAQKPQKSIETEKNRGYEISM